MLERFGLDEPAHGTAGLVDVRLGDGRRDIESFWEPHEKVGVERALACTVLGDPQQVAEGIAAFVERHKPDELMLTANLYDHRARLRSFELAMQAWHARHAG